MAKTIFKNSFLSILLCVLFSYSIHTEEDVCVEQTECLCRLNDDRIIDISHVLAKDEQPLSVAQGNLTYYFFPCNNIDTDKLNHPNVTPNNNNCKDGSSLCLYNATSNSLINLGKKEDAKFTGNIPKSLVFYRSNLTTIILLDCLASDKATYLIKDDQHKKDQFVLFSKHVCSEIEQHGLSTGSTLLILLCTGLGIYLIGGALVLHLLRGARGKEMIPNLDFWVDLPSLVKDGTVFLLSGCNPLSVTTVETYDRI